MSNLSLVFCLTKTINETINGIGKKSMKTEFSTVFTGILTDMQY